MKSRLGWLLLLASCGADSASTELWFRERARESGVDFVHARGSEGRYWLPEIMGSGVALFDYDGDGDLDLYCVQSGTLSASATNRPGNRLFRNDGRGSFEDVTERAGVGDPGYGMGCAVGDYDSDGDLDLYVTNLGPNVLYENRGDGTFTEVGETLGVNHAGWGTSAAFVDYDADGDLDLFLVNYLEWTPQLERECRSAAGIRDYCSPKTLDAPALDVLYENRGEAGFVDVTRTRGLDAARGNGLGVTVADFDGDGRLDFYVANDGNPNRLWLRQDDGTFRDEALLSGCAVDANGIAEAGMGVLTEDFDQDGDLDLFLTHLTDESNTFYVNEGGRFTDATLRSGAYRASLPDTGFGVGCADFDHDGHLDLYVANGRVERAASEAGGEPTYAQRDQLLLGRGELRFEPVLAASGITDSPPTTSRGLALGDLDRDGDVDVVVLDSDGPLRILFNETPKRGSWIAFDVHPSEGVSPQGAEVTLEFGGRTLRRRVSRAAGYLSSQSPTVHFGLGDVERVDTVKVRWPDGTNRETGPYPTGARYAARTR